METCSCKGTGVVVTLFREEGQEGWNPNVRGIEPGGEMGKSALPAKPWRARYLPAGWCHQSGSLQPICPADVIGIHGAQGTIRSFPTHVTDPPAVSFLFVLCGLQSKEPNP